MAIVNIYFTTEGIWVMKIRKMFAKKNEYVTKLVTWMCHLGIMSRGLRIAPPLS